MRAAPRPRSIAGAAALAAAWLAGAACDARAAEPTFADVPAWTSPVEDTRGLAVGDVDGDGDLDLVRASIDAATTLTLNAGGTFAATTAWRGPVEPTRAVALGDVDGDGDLDLVRGNAGRGATLYRNTGGTFEAAPAWTGPTGNARAIALGDVDGDGDLDLAIANSGEGATLFRNAGGTFAAAAAWTGPVALGNALALGDVDGDGDLDLVIGNLDEPSTLFRNTGGTFAAVAAWSGPVERTRGVALGDVDGDGDLDLVRGNIGTPATLTLNTGGTFDAAPAWTAPAESTWCVALGDVDGDGRIDLVRGNSERGSTLYLNAGGTFAASPAWSAPVADNRSIALADVDNDGDLDLVRGNLNQAATLHVNAGSPFVTAPAWREAPGDVRALALGDVDGDGDLDLVRGDPDAGVTLTRTTNGALESAPAWTAAGEKTFAVALADVDGDGDPDLVRGNYGQGSTLYLNAGGTFAATPAWTGPANTNTLAVAVGDVDGDGDPDLVLGNFDQQALSFVNAGGTFAVTPAWRGPVESTTSVALVDLDGDGDRDLVRGNQSAPATAYLNVGGTFAAAPAWTGPAEGTAAIAVGDVDGDGRPDLVRGNRDQGSTLYLGAGAAFAASPAWTGPVEPTQGVALADVDGDGDLDLVRGNVGQPASVTLGGAAGLDALPSATLAADSAWALAAGDVDDDGDTDVVAGTALFANRSPWLVAGVPSHALPNGAAHLRRVATDSLAENRVRIRFDAADSEFDPLWVTAEYAFAGSRQWTPVVFAGAASPAGPFATSPAGLAHTLVWDVTRVPFDRRDVVLRLHAASPPRRSGDIAYEPAYLRAAGRVVPVRPSMDATPATLAFPTVTVGDTVTRTLHVENRGNRDLVLATVDVPDAALSSDAGAGTTIAPGAARDVTVRLAPRTPLVAPGVLRLTGNDPARPAIDVAITTDVRDLAFRTQLLAVAPQLPLGEAATVIVSPDAGVHLESGWVVFRPLGAAAFADSAPLVPQGANFIALIPSGAVTEAGIEYYVRVANSGVERTDPVAAPAVVYTQAVAPPASAVAAAVPDERGVFPAGRATPIVVSLPAGAAFVSGTLYWRAGGSAPYDSVTLEPREVSPGIVAPAATVPAAVVGARGLEFRARVRTATTVLDDPADADAPPHVVRVVVDDLAEPATHEARRYRLVSVPLELDLPAEGTLAALLSDQPEFGPADVTRWRAFRWSPADSAYAEVGGGGDARLHPAPGRAFWLVAAAANALGTAPVPGRSTPTDTAFRVVLEPGWNMVGDPFPFRVAWNDVRATDAGGAHVALEPPVAWDEAAQRYAEGDVVRLDPFGGCWVRNPSAGPVTLAIPPREDLRLEAGPVRARGAEDGGLRLGVHATCGAAEARATALLDARARDGRDVLDRSAPPVAPGTALAVAFTGGDAPLAVDARAVPARGEARHWVFDAWRPLDDRASADGALAIDGLEALAPGVAARLVDRALGRVVDARAGAYAFACTRRTPPAGAADARFELWAGDAAAIDSALAASRAAATPPVTRLLPVFPSPTRGAATVRWTLARAAHVELAVFDVQGRRVRTLARGDREPGTHELAWRGDDDAGRALAAGVYVVRLEAAGVVDRRRVVRLP